MAAIACLWVPVFIFGNVFALLWLLPILIRHSARLRFWMNNRTSQKSQKSSLSLSRSDSVEIHDQLESEGEAGSSTDDGCIGKFERVRPVQVEWRGLGCSYKCGSSKKAVLSEVNGSALPGQLTAIMGPSGSGKSTMLDILARRKTTGKMTGSVLINGKPSASKFAKVLSYVPQENHFVVTMTAVEVLQFYAGLKLPVSWNAKDRQERVDSVLDSLGLSQQKNTVVGGHLPGGIYMRGLSGGQKRRLSIAVGLISAPSVIFLDEPTSGLDSFAALNVMQYLQCLAQKQGQTVLLSIHQPRIGIWNMFDRLFILSRGYLMYSGGPGGVVPWFSGHLGYGYNREVDGIEADWVMDLISVEFDKPEAGPSSTMHTERELVAASEEFKRMHALTEQVNSLSEDLEAGAITNPLYVDAVESLELQRDASGSFHSAYSAWQNDAFGIEASPSFKSGRMRDISSELAPKWGSTRKGTLCKRWRQFSLVCWRSFLSVTRNPSDVAGRMLTATWVSLFLGLICYGLPDDASTLITRVNVMFITSIVLLLFPYISVSLHTSDRQFFLADASAKLYPPWVYGVSKALVQLPFNVLNCAVFVLVIYGMAGLRDDADAFTRHLGIMVLAFLLFSQILQFCATVAPSEDMAFMLGVGFVATNVLFAKFFIRKQDMAFPILGDFHVVSAMGYAFEGLTQNELEHRVFTANCTGLANETAKYEDVLADIGLSPGLVSIGAVQVSDDNGTCEVSGDALLGFFEHDAAFWSTIRVLGLFLFIFHALTYLVLVVLARYPSKR